MKNVQTTPVRWAFGLRAVAFVLVGLMGVACMGSPSNTYVTSEIDAPEAIAAAWADYRTAMVDGDTEALVGLHTDNASITLQGAPPISGQAQVRQFMDRLFGAVDMLDFRVATEEITVHGNSAYELGRFFEDMRVNGEDTVKEGRYLCIWERQTNGRWRIRNMVELDEAAPPL